MAASEHDRAYDREYMRKRRTDPAFVERERANRKFRDGRRKIELGGIGYCGNPNLCQLCHQREATSTVERLIPLPTGFAPVTLRYCGVC